MNVLNVRDIKAVKSEQFLRHPEEKVRTLSLIIGLPSKVRFLNNEMEANKIMHSLFI